MLMKCFLWLFYDLFYFARRLRNFCWYPTVLFDLQQVEQENMEDLAVEVCGKNGVYYKVTVEHL